ncbi:MAG TPA: DUF167 domain-containing protein [Candidatus Binatia bacterium]|nr:DUF167 domain-containing protein [Candidatus Binatia bacterium]
MPPSEGWLAPIAGGTLLHVWVVPGASRSGIVGVHGEALRVRVAAPPEGGAANRELLVVLARHLGVRPADLTLEAGAHGREKRVRVRGLSVGDVRDRLAPIISVDRAGDRH